MSIDLGLEWLRNLMWAAVLSAGPAVLVVTVVALIVAVVQAATQVNDASVSFGPKALALVVALVVGGSWTFGQLTRFTIAVFAAIGRMGP